ncbi:DNA-processing protein DprA [Haliea sp. E17]|uniref:DNA-processing protein DprA n=1 Tax=Haliea sp. E17 TaxID=3401576 RepID=UPI003AADC52A
MDAVHPSGSADALLRPSDCTFPALLRSIPDPPQQLYVRGDPGHLQRPMLALVGARNASVAGLQAATSLAAAAVRVGLTVCSGLATGIDAAAHSAALDAGGSTVAVMGTGIDAIYPPGNRQLGERITAAGCLVTEYPPGTRPLPHHFPCRNRIISGLSLGVVVVEAALRSGSLITARLALEQGREVFALPWSNAHGGGAGCLHLLRDGAKMVQGIDDVLEEIGSLYAALRQAAPRQSGAAPEVADEEPGLLALIGDAEVPVDQLIQIAGLPVSAVLARLSALELAGRIRRGSVGYYRAD